MATTREKQPMRGEIKTTREVKQRVVITAPEGAPEWAESLAQLAASLSSYTYGNATVTSATIEGVPDGLLAVHASGKHIDLTESAATALAAALIEHLLARALAPRENMTRDELVAATLGVLDNKVPGAAE